jgi:hypothetical protein
LRIVYSMSSIDSTSNLASLACPTCARPLTPPFDVPLSGALDLVVLAIDLLHDLKATLERQAGL